MQKLPPFVLTSLTALVVLSSCANPHIFPRTQPLFVGFDDRHLTGKNRAALDEAKVDFLLARRDETPRYARLARKDPYSLTKTYQGRGYEITHVDDDLFGRHSLGPKIVIGSEVACGEPFSYDEIEVITY